MIMKMKEMILQIDPQAFITIETLGKFTFERIKRVVVTSKLDYSSSFGF